MEVAENTLDMLTLDDMLDFLVSQIEAYKRAKRADHQVIMNLDLTAIGILCTSVHCILDRVDRENKTGGR